MSEKPSNCPHFATCPMFEVFENEVGGKIFEKMYCKTERFDRCERYQKSERGEVVPKKLLPNGKLYAA
jgi:hypothetical protein